MYDSIILGCKYGEICLPSDDSAWVIPNESFGGDSGSDTTATAIGELSRTSPFPIHAQSQLSFFRMLTMVEMDTLHAHTIADTCTFTLELREFGSDTWIATLDSVGYLPGVISTYSSPPVFGIQSTTGLCIDQHLIELGSYADVADTVYLVWKVRISSSGQEQFCNINDTHGIPTKISDFFQPIYKATSGPSTVNPVSDMVLYPNPSSGDFWAKVVLQQKASCILSVYSLDGKHIGRVFSGPFNTGASLIPVQLRHLAPGTYLAKITGEDGADLEVRRFVIHR